MFVTSSASANFNALHTLKHLGSPRWRAFFFGGFVRAVREPPLRAHKGSKLAELYRHSKLLYAAVLEKMTQSRFANAKRKLDNPRQLTDWRLWRTGADDLKAGIKACFPVDARFGDDNIKKSTT